MPFILNSVARLMRACALCVVDRGKHATEGGKVMRAERH
jgi:hypothetical protein